MRKSKFRQALKKIWNFLWRDDSLASWIVSLALAFIIVKFIFFPFMSLILATSMPLVVVESGSMHHSGSFIGNAIGLQDNFELWWQERGDWYSSTGIEKSEAETWLLRTGLEMGDIVLVSGYGDIKVGDIIVFEADQKYPLIHRVVEIKEVEGRVYATKGDNNAGQLTYEKNISQDDIIGKAVLRIPKLGWVKLAFVKLFRFSSS